MFEKVSEFASEVVETMSRRSFVRQAGTGAAGLLAVLFGAATASAYPKPAQCCYYNCRKGNKSYWLWVKRTGGCIGCPPVATVDNIPNCRLVDFKCIQSNQRC